MTTHDSKAALAGALQSASAWGYRSGVDHGGGARIRWEYLHPQEREMLLDEAAAILAALPPDWCGHEAEITLLRDIAADNEAEIGMLVAERDLAQVERDVAEAALRQIAATPKAHKLVASICEIALAPKLDDIHGTPTFGDPT